MKDAVIYFAVGLAVLALLVVAARLLWGALTQGARALPEAVESVASAAGRAARVSDKAKQAFLDARQGK